MEPISLVLGVANLLGPRIAGYFAGDTGEAVAKEVISIAQHVTGHTEPVDAIQAIQHDPSVAAAFQQRIAEQEHKLKALAFADKADARDMYRQRHRMADTIAARIMVWNLPAVLLLACANIPIAIYVDDVSAAQLLGNLLGAACQQLWLERRTVVEFFFGAGLGTEPPRA